jgi:FKBP-type peptidyl-prolyl cis-trans isomerase SlyD
MVTLAYTLYDEDDDVVESSEPGDPLTYVHGYGQLVPGLERALEGLSKGAVQDVVVEAEDAYGDHDPEGVFEVDRSEFPDPAAIKIDDEFVAEGDGGHQLTMRVIEVLDEGVIVDTNHPLAGQKLRFHVEVGDVRPATAEEIEVAEKELAEAMDAHDDDHDHSACGHDHSHDHPHDHAHESPGGTSGLITLGVPRRGKDQPS